MPASSELPIALLTDRDPIELDESSIIELDGAGATVRELEHARKLLELLHVLQEQAEDDRRAASLLVEEVLLLHGPLGREQDALEVARRAFARDPSSLRVAYVYRRAAHATRAWDDVAKAAEGEARAARQPEYKAALLVERASILHQVRGDARAARVAYLEALEEAPRNLPALLGLEATSVELSAWKEASRWSVQIAEATGDGRLKAEYLARSANAALRSGAFELATSRLREARLHGSFESVRFGLERAFSRTGAYAELVELRIEQIQRGELTEAGWLDIGIMQRHGLGDEEAARSAFERAAQSQRPDLQEVALVELQLLAERAERWSDVIGAGQRRLELASEPEEKAALACKLGAIAAERLDDDELATRLFLRALAVDPCHAPTLEAAGRFFHRLGAIDHLVDMHRALVERSEDPEQQADSLCRLGILLVQRPESLPEGIECLQRGLAQRPGSLAALSALELGLTKAGDFEALADLYRHQLERLDGPVRRSVLLLRLGSLLAGPVDDPRGAMAAFEAALNEGPERAGPPEALMRLVEVAQSCGDHLRLARALERMLPHVADDPAERASIYERIGTAFERAGHIDDSLDAFRRAVEVAPAEHPVHVAAGSAFIRAERHHDLVALFEASAQRSEGAERARWWLKAAKVADRYLDDPNAALEFLGNAAELVPDDPEVARARLEISMSRAPTESLLEELSTSSRPMTVFRAGVMAEFRGHLALAKRCYRSAFDAQIEAARLPLIRVGLATNSWSDVLDAHAGLSSAEARYRTGLAALEVGDETLAREQLAFASRKASEPLGALLVLLPLVKATPRSAASICSRLEEAISDPAAKRAFAATRLRILESLGDLEGAVQGRWEAFEQRTSDPAGDLALEAFLRRDGDRKRLVALYAAQREAPNLDPELRVLVQENIATIKEELGARAEAAAAWERAFEADETASIVGRLNLITLHRGLGNEERALEHHRRLTQRLPRGALRARCSMVLGDQCLERGDLVEAERAYEAALDVLPTDPTLLRSLEFVYRALHRSPEGMLQALFRAFEAETQAEHLRALGVRLATELVRAERTQAARNVVDRTRAAAGSDTGVLMLHAELCFREGNHAEAVAALDDLVRREDTEDEVCLEALLRSCRLGAEGLHLDPQMHGRARLLASSRFDALDPTAERASVLADFGAFDLVEELLSRLAVAPGLRRSERHVLDLRRVELFREASRISEAVAVLGAMEAASTHIVELALELGDRSQDWGSLERLLESGLELELPVELELETRRQLARHAEHEHGDRARAYRHYRRMVELEPSRLDTWERLAELDTSGGGDRVLYLRRLAELEPTSIERHRALRSALVDAGDDDGAFCAEGLLIGLGEADEEIDYFYRQRRGRLPSRQPAPLPATALNALSPEHGEPAMRLGRALDPILSAIFPPDMAAYGSANESVPADIEQTVEEFAESFGAGPMAVRIIGGQVGPAVEPGDETIIMLPRRLMDQPPRELRFVIAALVCRASLGIYSDPLRANAPNFSLLRHVFEAVLRHCRGEGAHGDEARGSAMQRDIARRVGRALEVLPSDELTELAERLEDSSEATRIWLEGTHAAALRAGLTFAQDPAVGLAAASRHADMFGGEDRRSEAAGFLVSASHIELRTILGLRVST